MKKLLMLLVCFGIISADNYFVDNFLKYSTFYASYSLNSPLKTNTQFAFTGDGIVDISEEIEYDYNSYPQDESQISKEIKMLQEQQFRRNSTDVFESLMT